MSAQFKAIVTIVDNIHYITFSNPQPRQHILGQNQARTVAYLDDFQWFGEFGLLVHTDVITLWRDFASNQMLLLASVHKSRKGKKTEGRADLVARKNTRGQLFPSSLSGFYEPKYCGYLSSKQLSYFRFLAPSFQITAKQSVRC
jgi:hypothetical protein